MMVLSKMHAGGSGGEITPSCSAVLRGDKILTTVECLRGMLQAERVASRAAREEQHLMAKRLTEMERLLDIEIKAWNRAEKWLTNALKKLQTLKHRDISDSSTSIGTYYSARSVENGADSINSGNHFYDDDDDSDIRGVSEQDQSIHGSDFIENFPVEDSGNRHAHSYKFQSRNIEEEKGNNSENNQTYDFLVSIKQVKDQPHDSMGSRVTV